MNILLTYFKAHSIHNAIKRYTANQQKQNNDDDDDDNDDDDGTKHVIVVYNKCNEKNDNKIEEVASMEVKDTDAMLCVMKDKPRIHKDSGCVSDVGSFSDYGSQASFRYVNIFLAKTLMEHMPKRYIKPNLLIVGPD